MRNDAASSSARRIWLLGKSSRTHNSTRAHVPPRRTNGSSWRGRKLRYSPSPSPSPSPTTCLLTRLAARIAWPLASPNLLPSAHLHELPSWPAPHLSPSLFSLIHAPPALIPSPLNTSYWPHYSTRVQLFPTAILDCARCSELF